MMCSILQRDYLPDLKPTAPPTTPYTYPTWYSPFNKFNWIPLLPVCQSDLLPIQVWMGERAWNKRLGNLNI